MLAAVGVPDYYKVCHSYYPCGSPLESSAGTTLISNGSIEKGKRLLAEAGYDGTPVILMQPTDIPILSAASLVTAQRLRNIGMKVEIQAMDWSTLTSRRAKTEPVGQGGWNIFHTWWIGGDILNPVLATGMSGGGTKKAWFGWPDNAVVEMMRQEFALATDANLKKQLGDTIQGTVIDQGFFGNIGTFFVPVGYRNNVKGMIPSPVQFFWNMEVQH